MDFESILETRFVLAEMQKNRGLDKGGYVAHAGDALNLPFADETFDKIICSEVMEHVPDDNLACQELARVLKTNGLIAITVPTYFSEFIYNCLTDEYFSTPGGHVRKYMPKKLKAIMEHNGLEIYGVEFKHAFHTIWWMIRSVVGLHKDQHPITRAYHKFLTLGLFSRFMRKAESFCNYLFPKSIVLYAWKT